MKIKNKILIPGGTGFIGFHLAQFLKKKGWNVHSLSKHKPQQKRKIEGVKYICCDVSDKKKLERKMILLLIVEVCFFSQLLQLD